MGVLNFVRLCDRLFSQSPNKFIDGLPSLRLHNPSRFFSEFPFVDFGIVLYLQGKIFIGISGYSCLLTVQHLGKHIFRSVSMPGTNKDSD